MLNSRKVKVLETIFLLALCRNASQEHFHLSSPGKKASRTSSKPRRLPRLQGPQNQIDTSEHSLFIESLPLDRFPGEIFSHPLSVLFTSHLKHMLWEDILHGNLSKGNNSINNECSLVSILSSRPETPAPHYAALCQQEAADCRPGGVSGCQGCAQGRRTQGRV